MTGKRAISNFFFADFSEAQRDGSAKTQADVESSIGSMVYYIRIRGKGNEPRTAGFFQDEVDP
jgi:hypothetical protein